MNDVAITLLTLSLSYLSKNMAILAKVSSLVQTSSLGSVVVSTYREAVKVFVVSDYGRPGYICGG